MRLAVFSDAFPVLSETFVVTEIKAVRRLGHEVVVIAGRPGDVLPDEDALIRDEVPAARAAADLAWLATRHPRRAGADLRDRGIWRPREHPRPWRTLASAA